MTVREMFTILSALSASSNLLNSETLIYIKDAHGKLIRNNFRSKIEIEDYNDLEIIRFSINTMTNTLKIKLANNSSTT